MANVMKIVVEETTTAWIIYRHMFGFNTHLGVTTPLKDALIMANNLAESENMVIEMRLTAPVGDGEYEVQSHYLHNETDVLQAILTYC